MWQEVIAGLVVALAIVYLGHKVFGMGRRRPRSATRPDVPVKRLTRKKDGCH